MALQRSLYSTQFLKLYINETIEGELGATESALTLSTGAGVWSTNYLANLISGLPVQTASIERTIPTEDVLVLGKLGSMGRQQKEVETVKMDIKLFWASGERASTTETGIANLLDTRITANTLVLLTGNALQGERSIIVVEPNGFTGYGILTNFSIDGGVGDFLTASMSFEGFGTPIITNTTNNAATESSYAPKSVFVYTSENVILGDNDYVNVSPTETIKSAKFSLDIPTERLTRIGARVTGFQTDPLLTGNHLLVAKPPFKVSVSYDGEFVTGAHSLEAITFGHVKFTPVSANITSQNYSQNAGDVGASMSFSSEGTSVVISAV